VDNVAVCVCVRPLLPRNHWREREREDNAFKEEQLEVSLQAFEVACVMQVVKANCAHGNPPTTVRKGKVADSAFDAVTQRDGVLTHIGISHSSDFGTVEIWQVAAEVG
jgi:hypothetical protein